MISHSGRYSLKKLVVDAVIDDFSRSLSRTLIIDYQQQRAASHNY